MPLGVILTSLTKVLKCVTVIALAGHPLWLSKVGLKTGGPIAFGYVFFFSKSVPPWFVQCLTDFDSFFSFVVFRLYQLENTVNLDRSLKSMGI